MPRLQNCWYHFVAELLSLDPASFQLFQPALPIAPTDASLWKLLDIAPPASLVFDPGAVDTVRFSASYAAITRQFRMPAASLADAIGASNAQNWSGHLATLARQPAPHELAALFQNWAARHAIAATSAGVAFFSRAVLMQPPALPPGAEAAPFVGGYSDLLRLLQAAPGCHGSFDSRMTPAQTSEAWTHETTFDGLWSHSGDTPTSRKFAASRITAHVAVDRCATWTATPGAWYSSSLLNTAYSDAASPPWPVDARPSWTDMFAPGGRLCRALASLVVVDGISLTMTSDAKFDADEQRMILDHASKGLWPLYAAASDSVRTSVAFQHDGAMTIEIVTEAGHPMALGGNVLDIASYLGHAPTGYGASAEAISPLQRK